MIRVGSPRFSQGKPKKLVEEQWGINSKHIRQLLASDFTDGYRFPIERNHRLLTHARVQVDLDATDKLILMFFHHNLCGVPDVVAQSTPCRFGGVRWWFACNKCEKSVRLVYFVGSVLHCRTCAGLVHKSTRTSHDAERSVNRAERFDALNRRVQS